jgi:hypothetical protein
MVLVIAAMRSHGWNGWWGQLLASKVQKAVNINLVKAYVSVPDA